MEAKETFRRPFLLTAFLLWHMQHACEICLFNITLPAASFNIAVIALAVLMLLTQLRM